MNWLAGIDIGGTKCAVSIGRQAGGSVEICYKEKFPTPSDPHQAVAKLVETLDAMTKAHPEVQLEAVGGGFNIKLTTLQDAARRAQIAGILREFAAEAEQIEAIVRENLPRG